MYVFFFYGIFLLVRTVYIESNKVYGIWWYLTQGHFLIAVGEAFSVPPPI